MGVPTYMFKLENGELKSEVFDSEQLPEGWVDSPAKCAPPDAPEMLGALDTSKTKTAKAK